MVPSMLYVIDPGGRVGVFAVMQYQPPWINDTAKVLTFNMEGTIVRLPHPITTQAPSAFPINLLSLLLPANMESSCKTEPFSKSKDSRPNGTLTSSSPSSRHPRWKSSQRVQKSKNPPRTSARLQGKALNTLSSLGLQQEPPNGCKEQVDPYQPKRRRNSEEEPQLSSEKARPEKRARKSASTVSDESQPLNAENLKDHTVREGYVPILELMDSESGSIRGSRGSKRSASRSRMGNGSTASTGIVDQETASQVTQKSSYTAAHYRLTILARANIIFQFQPAPKNVCTRIAAVFQRLIPKERKKELSRIAHTLHNQFAPVLSGAAREDDCLELTHQALSSLGYDDSLLLPRKAGMVP